MVATLTEAGPQPGVIVANGDVYEIKRGFFTRANARKLKAQIKFQGRQLCKTILDEIPADSTDKSLQEMRRAAVAGIVKPLMELDDLNAALQDPDLMPCLIGMACDVDAKKAEEIADSCDMIETMVQILECVGLNELKNSAPPKITGDIETE